MTENEQLDDHEERLRHLETKASKLNLLDTKIGNLCGRISKIEELLQKHNKILYVALGVFATIQLLLQFGVIKIPT